MMNVCTELTMKTIIWAFTFFLPLLGAPVQNGAIAETEMVTNNGARPRNAAVHTFRD